MLYVSAWPDRVFLTRISRGAKLWAAELQQFKCESMSDRNHLREEELQTSTALERLSVQQPRREGTWTGKRTDAEVWDMELGWSGGKILNHAGHCHTAHTYLQREHGSKGLTSRRRMTVLGFGCISWLPLNRHSWVSALGWREEREQGIAVVQGRWAKSHP